jgi:hypothetical protein
MPLLSDPNLCAPQRSYKRLAASVPLRIRTTRVFAFPPEQGGWREIHHHGSLDAPEALARYQRAVRAEAGEPRLVRPGGTAAGLPQERHRATTAA